MVYIWCPERPEGIERILGDFIASSSMSRGGSRRNRSG